MISWPLPFPKKNTFRHIIGLSLVSLIMTTGCIEGRSTSEDWLDELGHETTDSDSQTDSDIGQIGDKCPNDPLKTHPGICGCGVPDDDDDSDGTPDCEDDCPSDPDKTEMGVCGCGVPDSTDDSDLDSVPDCRDSCESDPLKVQPGICGCGTPDDDSDGDGTPDCDDDCPSDPGKTKPGICGCGTLDNDSDGDKSLDCLDDCPNDPGKTKPGVCGCGTSDNDSDGDKTADCIDGCPDDPDKTAPGICGCGTPDDNGVCGTATALQDVQGIANGMVDFEFSTGILPLYVDGEYDSGGWVLIGRGREGWAWSEEGLGDPTTLAEGLGTSAAFSPAYLATTTIQELLKNSQIDMEYVEIRIKRAAAVDGSAYQEVLWRAQDRLSWTWLFETGPYNVSYTIKDSLLGTGSSGSGNTRDLGANDQNRVFTWAWDSHANKRGFSYGSSVSVGSTDPTNFLWQAGTENHAIPYSEVYIRYRPL